MTARVLPRGGGVIGSEKIRSKEFPAGNLAAAWRMWMNPVFLAKALATASKRLDWFTPCLIGAAWPDFSLVAKACVSQGRTWPDEEKNPKIFAKQSGAGPEKAEEVIPGPDGDCGKIPLHPVQEKAMVRNTVIGVVVGTLAYWAGKAYLGGLITDIVALLLVVFFILWSPTTISRLKREIACLKSGIQESRSKE